MLVPVGIVAQAAGVASYPFLADLVARKEFPRFHQTLNVTLRNTLTLLIPLSVWMMIVAAPTITIIFQQGRFGTADALQTTLLLQIFLLAVGCWGVQQIVGRAFYARQDTVTPAVIGTLATVAALPLFYLCTLWFRAAGVAAASTLALALYTAVLGLRWRSCYGPDAFAGLGKAALQITTLSLATGGPTVILVKLVLAPWQRHPYLTASLAITASGLCFLLIFGLLSVYFTPALVRPYLEKAGPLGRRLLRGNQ
jgi:putative peptidoglycan lipid II flippase